MTSTTETLSRDLLGKMDAYWRAISHALVWFLVNDRLKLLAYRILEPAAVKRTPAKG